MHPGHGRANRGRREFFLDFEDSGRAGIQGGPLRPRRRRTIRRLRLLEMVQEVRKSCHLDGPLSWGGASLRSRVVPLSLAETLVSLWNERSFTGITDGSKDFVSGKRPYPVSYH